MNAAVEAPVQKELDLEDIRFLDIKKVVSTTGMSKASVYRLIKAGSFPKPVKYGSQMARWVESEIKDWQRQQMRARTA